MTDKPESHLSHMFSRLAEVEKEAIAALGEHQAHFFVEIWNDWFEVLSTIMDNYKREELIDSATWLAVQALSKEVSWFDTLFLSGNFPLLGRSLRFVLELVFRANHADSNAGDVPVEEKFKWLESENKERRLGRGGCIRPTLERAFPQTKNEELG